MKWTHPFDKDLTREIEFRNRNACHRMPHQYFRYTHVMRIGSLCRQLFVRLFIQSTWYFCNIKTRISNKTAFEIRCARFLFASNMMRDNRKFARFIFGHWDCRCPCQAHSLVSIGLVCRSRYLYYAWKTNDAHIFHTGTLFPFLYFTVFHIILQLQPLGAAMVVWYGCWFAYQKRALHPKCHILMAFAIRSVK